MANTNATTVAKWIDQKWDRIDVAAYEEQVFATLIEDKQAMHGQLHIPYHANVSVATVAAGGGSGLTFSANTESEATISPTTYSAHQEVEMATIARAIQDPRGVLRGSLVSAIAQQIDIVALQAVASLTTNPISSSGISKGDITKAVALGAAGGKQFWKPGQNGPFCVVHVSQVNDLLNIDGITNAQIRGDDANPVVTGWVAKAYGVDFYESGNVYVTGGNCYNVVCIPRAFGISYNQRPTPKVDEFMLTFRVYCWTDVGVGIVRDAYAVQIVAPATV